MNKMPVAFDLDHKFVYFQQKHKIVAANVVPLNVTFFGQRFAEISPKFTARLLGHSVYTIRAYAASV